MEQIYRTTKEAATYLRLSTRTLQDLRDKKRLAFFQIGRKVYYLQADLDAYVGTGRINPRTR
jgi:excisionase family DNA binding protein